MAIPALCQQLGLTYTELIDQPAWWVDAYQLLLIGKSKYEETQAKKAERNRP